MGKASETCNHVPMGNRVAGEVSDLGQAGNPCQLLEQAHALLLHVQVFGVLQGQIKEHLVNGRQALVVICQGLMAANQFMYVD